MTDFHRSTCWLFVATMLMLSSGCSFGRSWFQMSSDSGGPRFGFDMLLPQGRTSLLDDVSQSGSETARLQHLTFSEESAHRTSRWSNWLTPGQSATHPTSSLSLDRTPTEETAVSPQLITPPVEQF